MNFDNPSTPTNSKNVDYESVLSENDSPNSEDPKKQTKYKPFKLQSYEDKRFYNRGN